MNGHPPPLPPRIREVVREVALAHAVSPRMIFSENRTKRVYAARREAMRAVRSLPWIKGAPPSYPQIGRWFGRDHSTVIHACRQ